MKITNNVDEFVKDLINGKVVCFKTDTIWGLSANPFAFEALKKIYEIKKRSLDKPFIFLIKNNEDLSKITKPLSNLENKILKKYWPGPISIIFEYNKNCSLLNFYQNKQTVALRKPKDENCQTILEKINFPLPSTSINVEGNRPINNFIEIKKFLKNEDVTILKLNGKRGKSRSSSLIKVENNKIVFLRK